MQREKFRSASLTVATCCLLVAAVLPAAATAQSIPDQIQTTQDPCPLFLNPSRPRTDTECRTPSATEAPPLLEAIDWIRSTRVGFCVDVAERLTDMLDADELRVISGARVSSWSEQHDNGAATIWILDTIVDEATTLRRALANEGLKVLFGVDTVASQQVRRCSA